ncbi:MAG TPA: secretin N-terminal domain-containing protein, partial [Planctomycetota bacterium]|nr:secretin N-terminal domain-containing protein [Planctomycetota bacterium]
MHSIRRRTPRFAAPLACLAGSLALGLSGCAAASKGTLPPETSVTLHDEATARWQITAPSPGPIVPAPIAAAAPPAEPAPAEPATIPQVFRDPAPRSLQLRGAELGQALRLLASTGGINLVLDGDFSQTVDLDLPELPLQAAFELLVRTHACDVSLADGVVLVRRDDPLRVETRVFPLQFVAAATVQPELVPLVGTTAIVVNAARNVLLVTASQEKLRDVETYLSAVDRPDRQVLIEARILEVSRSRLEELGTRIAFNDISVNDGTATLVSSLLTTNKQALATITDADGGFDAAINALHQLAGLEVLSRPRLLALNNKQSKLDIIKEVPYVNATTTTAGSTTSVGTQTIQTVEYKEIGLKLAITPTVMDGGLIGLNIDQEVSEQTGVFQGVPIVDSRHITTGFVVRQGETIMIGGLLKDRRTTET